MIYEMYCPGCGATFIGSDENDTIHEECGTQGRLLRLISQEKKS